MTKDVWKFDADLRFAEKRLAELSRDTDETDRKLGEAREGLIAILRRLRDGGKGRSVFVTDRVYTLMEGREGEFLSTITVIPWNEVNSKLAQIEAENRPAENEAATPITAADL